jgi:hypothetical protein
MSDFISAEMERPTANLLAAPTIPTHRDLGREEKLGV